MKIIFSAILFYTTITGAKDEMLKSQLIKLNFGQEYIELSISKLAQSDSQFSRLTDMTDAEAMLVFSTPQFASGTESKVRVKLLNDFKGMPTLEEDFIKANFKKDDIVGNLGKPQKIKNKKMNVFMWITPTFGSAIYFYIQNPHNNSMAIRIGPFASMVAKDFAFDWSKVRWGKPSKKLLR